MEAHEYANIFPMLSPEKLSELADDIKENGLLDPIIRYQGKILDGRNRLLACEQSGIRPRFDEFGGDDDAALSFVMSKNLKRRHLTTGEASLIGARYATLKHGTNRYSVDRSADRSTPSNAEAALIGARYANAKTGGDHMITNRSPDRFVEVSNAEAAAMVEVSEKSIRRAKKVIKDGVPALEEMVKANKIKVRTAATIAALPKAEQDELCARGVDALKKKASEIQAAQKQINEGEEQERSAPLQKNPTTQPQKKITQYVLTNAVEIATQAIGTLGRISKDDPTRQEALQEVINYCNKRITTNQ